MTQILGRFGRLIKTLNEEKNKIAASITQGENKYQEVLPSSSVTSEKYNEMRSILEWLAICLSEGHIEPSQLKVGRLLGWPLRPFLKNSLYIDFECLCIHQGLSDKNIANRKLFYSVTDKIFIPDGGQYIFPTLEECVLKFKQQFDELVSSQKVMALPTTGSGLTFENGVPFPPFLTNLTPQDRPTNINFAC